jgi:hypothetical protein
MTSGSFKDWAAMIGNTLLQERMSDAQRQQAEAAMRDELSRLQRLSPTGVAPGSSTFLSPELQRAQEGERAAASQTNTMLMLGGVALVALVAMRR